MRNKVNNSKKNLRGLTYLTLVMSVAIFSFNGCKKENVEDPQDISL